MLKLTKKTGIFYHQGIDSYHSGPGISKTGLCKLDEAAASYKHYCCQKEIGHRPSSASKDLGKIFHALMDGSFYTEYAIVPDIRRGTKAWLAEEKKHAGKMLVKAKDVEISIAMADAVKRYESELNEDLLSAGDYEVSYYWRDKITGLLCKCRPDFISSDQKIVVDFKTARRVEHEGFKWDAYNYHYYVSAAFTLQGVEAVTGIRPDRYIFLVVCSEPPHLVASYEASTEEIELGKEFISRNLINLKICNFHGHWPGLPATIKPLGLPYRGIQELEEYQRIEHEFSYLIG